MPRGRNKAPGAKMSAKQMKRKKPINEDYLINIEPLTDNQTVMFDAYESGKNLFAYGCAGTGKTFVALHLALKDVLNEYTPYEKVYIVRSLVSTREIGFLPGTHEDKASLYFFQALTHARRWTEKAFDHYLGEALLACKRSVGIL